MSDHCSVGSYPSRPVLEAGLILVLAVLLLGQAAMAGMTAVQIVEEVRSIHSAPAVG